MFGVGVQRSRSGDYLFFDVQQPDDVGGPVPEGRRAHGGVPDDRRRGSTTASTTSTTAATSSTSARTTGGATSGSSPRPSRTRARENWKELIAHRDDVMLEDIDLFAGWGAVYERQDALPRIRILDFQTGTSHRIEFPEAIYAAGPENNRGVRHEQAPHRTTSRFTTPPAVYDYDVETKERTLLKQKEVLGGYDPSHYVSERRYATASDGTKIPISIVYRKGFVRDGKAPLLLGAYGSYGAPSDVEFDSNEVSLLDRGVVLALAHIRGGGDLGKKWHDEGRMMTKKNTFTDFIAVRRAADRRPLHVERPPRDRGRQRRRAARWAR